MNHIITLSATFGLLAVLFVLYLLTVDTNTSIKSKQYVAIENRSIYPMLGTGGRYYRTTGYICATNRTSTINCNPARSG